MEMKERIIVTGATGGMGSAAVEALASQGKGVIMACRNQARAEVVRGNVLSHHPKADISIKELDLASTLSVRRFAESIVPGTVTGLFNNAGTISRNYSLTPDGLENTFAVNYFSPWLLTCLLAGKLPKGGHIVNMVSITCRFANISAEGLRPAEKDFRQLRTYAASKRALLSFTMEFARRNPQLVVNMADPGVVATGIINLGHWYDPISNVIFKPFCKRPEEGVKPALRAIASETGNRYFVGSGSREIPNRYLTPELDKLLWNETEKILR